MVVSQNETGIEKVSGNQCKRGREYAIAECTNPVRTVTSTIAVLNGELPVAPVKTDKPIPKQLISECMREINQCIAQAPVRIGDIIIRNILDTGSNIMATSNISAAEEINDDKKLP
jgi:CxxC motif-containing protein